MTILKSIGKETKISLESEFHICCFYLYLLLSILSKNYCKITEVFNFQRFFAMSKVMSRKFVRGHW